MSSQAPQNDPFVNRLLGVLLPYVLTTVGLGGGYVAAQKITQIPTLQIGIALFAGGLIYALSFAGRVLQKLDSAMVDKTAAWLPSFLDTIFGGYRRRYLYYLSHAHRVLEFNGLKQLPAYNRELEHIFVQLEIAPVPPHLASPHLFNCTQASTAEAHDIWHYLGDKMLSSHALVILGAAGSGKTTLLKYIACSLSRSRAHFKLRRKYHLRASFPILLYVREYASIIKDKPERTLPELLQEDVQSKRNLTIPLHWIELQLKQGRCVVMLDGLDEAPEEERRPVKEWVQKQIISYANNRFILTARPHGYVDTPLDGATVLNIQPFTFAQVKSFVKNWYLVEELMRSGKNDLGTQMRASEGAGNLLARLLQKPSLMELAVNPLLLTMITILYSTGGSLPENRVDLYREIFEVLLYRRREAIGLAPKLSVHQKLEVLQPLAFHMMQRRLLEIEHDRVIQVITPHLAKVSLQLTPAEFLKDIEQNSGLFLKVNRETWAFAHKTLQEYLTATDLKERRRESVLLKHISDDWWHETICFYCAQADATKIIQACLALADTSVQMLNLALACNNQKLKADVSVTQKIDELLQTGVEDTDSRKRSIVAEALLRRRLEQMVYLSDDVYVDTSLISCAEYQLFLDEQSAQGRYYHPWHWRSPSFPANQGHEPVLGVQPLEAQAFCTWLNNRESGVWHYRLPRKEEVPHIASRLNEKTLSRHGIGYWNEDRQFAWLDGPPPRYDNLEELVIDRLLLDRAEALNYDHVRAGDKHDPVDEALDLERRLNNAGAPDVTRLIVQGLYAHPLAPDMSSFDFYANFKSALLLSHDILSDAMKTVVPFVHQYFVLTDERTSPPDTQEQRDLRWFIRYLAQLLVRNFYLQLQQIKISPRRRWQLFPINYAIVFPYNYSRAEKARQKIWSEEGKAMTEQAFAFYRKICIDFALLELRVAGKLPPWEGILLVKERKEHEVRKDGNKEKEINNESALWFLRQKAPGVSTEA